MKVLGLVGSYRKLGNTEILTKEALMTAQENGAEVAMIRLTDLSIELCKGCMACVVRNVPCNIDDDMEFLISQMLEADGIIVGAPTYFLGPAGIIKMITDRYIQIAHRLDQFKGKVGATIAVAGRNGWDGLTMPLLNMFLLGAQIKLINSMLAFVPGPGEILLEPSYLAKAREIGFSISQYLRSSQKEEINYSGEKEICPSCFSNVFYFIDKWRIECPICGSKGSVDKSTGKIVFDNGEESRIGFEAFKEHIEEWVIPSARWYKEKLKDIQPLQEKYQEFNPWVFPPKKD